MLETRVPVFDAACAYIRRVLRLEIDPRPTRLAGQLPFFVSDAYALADATILGREALLMAPKPGAALSVGELARHVAAVNERVGLPVVVALERMRATERQQLIERNVAFVVPENQLYLPPLGVDLREYFRAPLPRDTERLSPSSQAMLINTLLTPWSADRSVEDLRARLGFSAMTVSRAMQELLGAKLGSIVTVGRSKRFRFNDGPESVWERAQSVLVSPVKQRVWLHVSALQSASREMRLAGLTALAGQTSLVEPVVSVHAIEQSSLRRLRTDGVRVLSEPQADTIEVEVWAYSPGIQRNSRYVDPLSLMLSLRGTTDERVELAVEELKETIPWLQTHTQSAG